MIFELVSKMLRMRNEMIFELVLETLNISKSLRHVMAFAIALKGH